MPKYTQITPLLKGIRRHCDSQGHSIKIGFLEAGTKGPYSYWFTCADCDELFEIDILDAHDPRYNRKPEEAWLNQLLTTPQGRHNLIQMIMGVALDKPFGINPQKTQPQ